MAMHWDKKIRVCPSHLHTARKMTSAAMILAVPGKQLVVRCVEICSEQTIGEALAKRFFVSHSSTDKPVARALKGLLEDNAWIDLHEIDIGDILLEEITTGIEGASDFVLLWSLASSASPWVKFEFHMAFIRWLEDNAVAIRVICLDSTPVPLYLRPFLQARGKSSPEDIAAALRGSVPPPSPRRAFLNRHVEVGLIEEALYDPKTTAIFICGMPGIGKRSLAREALGRTTMGSGTVQRIPVSAGVAEPELNLLIARALAVDPVDERSALPVIQEHNRQMLTAFAASGGIWVFEDAGHWLHDDGTLGRICVSILESLSAADTQTSKLVVFTSRRKPNLQAWASSTSSYFLSGLAERFSVPLLRAHGASGTDHELGEISRALDGHPLALEVVAPRLPLDPAALREQRIAIATDLVDPASISPATWGLLEVLALIDGPVRGEDLADFQRLPEDDFQAVIAEAAEYSLLTFDDTGSLSLHALLRDYFLRSFRKQPDHRDKTADLADLLLRRFGEYSPHDALYVPSLLATVKILGLAGRFEEARSLRKGLIGTLHQTAIELYQEKRYQETLLYIDEALTGVEEFDTELLQLRAKTLAYLDRVDEAKSLADSLVAKDATNASVLRDRGRVAFIARDWAEAIDYFQRAIPYRRNPAQLWSDVAQARIRMEDWAGAVAAAKTSIDIGGDTPWTLASYSEALERLGNFREAERMMSLAVNREPNNPGYRHRLGRIAQQTGNRPLAVEQFKRSVEIDPNFRSVVDIARQRARRRRRSRGR